MKLNQIRKYEFFTMEKCLATGARRSGHKSAQLCGKVHRVAGPSYACRV